MDTLDSIKESGTARLNGNHDRYRILSCMTRALLGKDKKRCVRGLVEDVDSHLNADDLRPSY